jgi:hypothetical protein
MTDQRHLLKIKAKHLAAEARIIRHAERKLQLPTFSSFKSDSPLEPNRTETVYYTKAQRDQDPGAVAEAAKGIRLLVRRRRAAARNAEWYDRNRSMLASMQSHRRGELRREARATHLAYGFLRGRVLAELEGNRDWIDRQPEKAEAHAYRMFHDRPVYERAIGMVSTYGAWTSKERVEKAEAFRSWLIVGGIGEPYLPETPESRNARLAQEEKERLEYRLRQLQMEQERKQGQESKSLLGKLLGS